MCVNASFIPQLLDLSLGHVQIVNRSLTDADEFCLLIYELIIDPFYMFWVVIKAADLLCFPLCQGWLPHAGLGI